jgi:hypothetical protein
LPHKLQIDDDQNSWHGFLSDLRAGAAYASTNGGDFQRTLDGAAHWTYIRPPGTG